jgi:hypothetical protein
MPPRWWYRKIRLTRRGRELPIIHIIEYENEQVCEQLWRS